MVLYPFLQSRPLASNLRYICVYHLHPMPRILTTSMPSFSDKILPLQPFYVTKTYQFSSPCMATFVSIAPNPCVSSLSISAAFHQSVPNPITYPRLVPEIYHSRYNIRKLHWSIICWTRVRKNVCCIYLWLLVTKTDGWAHWHKDMCIYRVLDLWLLYKKRASVCVRRIDKWNVR